MGRFGASKPPLDVSFYCTQIVCVKTITYPLRLSKELYRKAQAEARKRDKKLSDIFRELISYGFQALPPMPEDNTRLVADTWEKLGPAPEIDYDKL